MGKQKKGGGGDDGGGAGSVNTEAHVQLLGLGLDGSDVTPSVLLVFDKQRFLFNAGEGFQVRRGGAVAGQCLCGGLSLTKHSRLPLFPASVSVWSTASAWAASDTSC